MADLLDWSQVNSRVSLFKKSQCLKSATEAFNYLCLDTILGIDLSEIASSITDGSGDRGIDAVFIDSRPEKLTIHLFQTKYVSKFESTKRNFPSNECDKILSFISECLQKSEGLKDTCNAALWGKVQDIWAAIEENVYTFQINLCSNARPLQKTQSARFENQLRRIRNFQVEEYDLERFAATLIEHRRTTTTLNIQLFGEQSFERTDGYARGIIGTTGGSELVNFLKDKNFPLEVDKNLFEENIRLYLGEKNEVNSKILTSALSDSPAEFWYLNNGITIVCDSYRYQPSSHSPLVEISNPQIVNGGQTSYALFEAARTDSRRVGETRVLLRIIETKDRALMNRIAEATNSQTPIRSRDLRSNDQIQQKFESTLEALGYYYERKRNQHIDKPLELRIDALKAGQIIVAYFLKEPDRAKTQSDRIFGELYELVFDPTTMSAERFLAAYKLFNEIETKRKLAIQKMRSITTSDYSEQWLVEGIFHALFMVSVLCDRDGIPNDDYDTAKTKVDEALYIVGNFARRQRGASAYRLFRSAHTKLNLRQFSPTEQLELGLS